MSVNQVTLLGKVESVSGLTHTDKGVPALELTVVTRERRGQEMRDNPLVVKAFGDIAEIASSMVTKGTEVTVLGKMWCRKRADKAGQLHTVIEVVADVLRVSQPMERRLPLSKAGHAEHFQKGLNA